MKTVILNIIFEGGDTTTIIFSSSKKIKDLTPLFAVKICTEHCEEINNCKNNECHG